MGKYLLDDHGVLNAGDHFDSAAAFTARFGHCYFSHMSCVVAVSDMLAEEFQPTNNEAIRFDTTTVMNVQTCKIARRCLVRQKFHITSRIRIVCTAVYTLRTWKVKVIRWRHRLNT